MKQLLLLLTVGVLVVAEAAGQSTDIHGFVRQNYVEGISYEQASAFDSTVVPVLLTMLGDSTETAYWSNIVATLCIVGNQQVTAPLIAFIEADSGILSHDYYRAKKSAVMSLGYLVNSTRDPEALAYLVESLNPSSWTDRGLQYVGPVQDAAMRNADLSIMAMMGLALSGHSEAMQALQSVPGFNYDPLTKEGVEHLMQAALEVRGEVAASGLIEYYRKESAKQ